MCTTFNTHTRHERRIVFNSAMYEIDVVVSGYHTPGSMLCATIPTQYIQQLYNYLNIGLGISIDNTVSYFNKLTVRVH